LPAESNQEIGIPTGNSRSADMAKRPFARRRRCFLADRPRGNELFDEQIRMFVAVIALYLHPDTGAMGGDAGKCDKIRCDPTVREGTPQGPRRFVIAEKNGDNRGWLAEAGEAGGCELVAQIGAVREKPVGPPNIGGTRVGQSSVRSSVCSEKLEDAKHLYSSLHGRFVYCNTNGQKSQSPRIRRAVANVGHATR
jgi:hypothetical protein